MVKLLHKAT